MQYDATTLQTISLGKNMTTIEIIQQIFAFSNQKRKTKQKKAVVGRSLWSRLLFMDIPLNIRQLNRSGTSMIRYVHVSMFLNEHNIAMTDRHTMKLSCETT